MAFYDEPGVDVGLVLAELTLEIPLPLGLVSWAKVVPGLSPISSPDSHPLPLTIPWWTELLAVVSN